jgi:tungstate transport system substrate-binding protein
LYVKQNNYGGENMKKKALILTILGLILFSGVLNAEQRMKMSTTTSTDNSGLLEALIPPFEKMFDIKVDIIAVGTGKALKLGENGDVDIVFVHARGAEDKFVDAGFGVNRRDVMYNDFVIIGPENDPAGIKGMKDAALALKKIAEAKAPFISRGDDSGTHKKEKKIWEKVGISTKGQWYQEVGQGMGAVLKIADEKKAYTMADRGTFLSFSEKISLPVLCEGDPVLYNPYGIIAVNPAKHAHVNYVNAMALIGWITSIKGQEIIRELGKEKFNQPLFKPMVIK